MILYLDTTAFVKLFVREDSSALVQAQLTVVDVVATSRVTYAEACDAFSRRRDEGRLSASELQRVCEQLDASWPQFAVIDLNERAAGDVTVKHGLRGHAAIHIAAALELKAHADDVPLVFCSFDEKQARVAEAEGLAVMAQ